MSDRSGGPGRHDDPGQTSDSGVRARTVVLAALLVTGLSWALLRWWESTGRGIAVLPWLGVVPMLLLSAVVLLAGWQVQSWTSYRATIGRRPSGARPAAARAEPMEISPQRARGTLVAAQAAALGGGLLLGWYAGNALIHAPDIDVPAVRDWWWRALVSALAAGGLAAAGLAAQRMCRIPPDGGDGGRSDAVDGNPAR